MLNLITSAMDGCTVSRDTIHPRRGGTIKITATLLGAVLLTGGALCAMAQDQIDKTSRFKSGQVWMMGQAITVTILAIEDVHKLGRVVHVRVDKIPLQSCGEVHLTRAIEHLAVTEKMMLKGGLVLSKENVDLPESSVEAYLKWQAQKKPEIAKTPLQKAILTVGDAMGPMICNLVPART